MEEPEEHTILSNSMHTPLTELSPSFEPFSYNVDSYAGLLEDFDIPYPFSLPDADDALPQTFNKLSPAALDESPGQIPNLIASDYCFRDREGNKIWISAIAQLNGNFFVADIEDIADTGPSQLTCYRRNIFGVSGFISFPKAPGRNLDVNGHDAIISSVEVCVSAFESIHKTETELVHMPLRPIGSDIQIVEEKTQIIPLFSETPFGEDQKLDLAEGTTFAFEWKRLQFRKATANNGGRRGVQQQFHIRISLLVTLETGVIITIADMGSSPLIVRGRNPSNFIHQQSLPSPSSLSIRQSNLATVNRATSPISIRTETSPGFKQNANAESTLLDFHFSMQRYGTSAASTFDIDETHSWLRFDQKEQPIQPISTNSEFQKSSSRMYSPAASYSYPPPSSRISNGSRVTSTKVSSGKHPADDVDTLSTSPPNVQPTVKADERTNDTGGDEPLYEYFPLGLNGWMPPVAAVYRPHIAHDTMLVPDLKGLIIK